MATTNPVAERLGHTNHRAAKRLGYIVRLPTCKDALRSDSEQTKSTALLSLGKIHLLAASGFAIYAAEARFARRDRRGARSGADVHGAAHRAATRTQSTNFSMSLLSVIWLGALTVVGVERLWRARRVVAGTTLARGPWWWAVASFAAVVSVEWCAAATGATAQTLWLQPARFAAAATTFGPFMSILGAQSPQERAWPWIVASLWLVLALPAAEVLVLQQGQTLEIHAARGAFLWLLVGMQLLQALPTSFRMAGALTAAAEIALLGDALPGIGFATGPLAARWGLTFGVAAIAMISRGLPDRTMITPLDRAWLDFRDLFGALWALRVAERLNAFAIQQRWQIALHWNGWATKDNDPDSARPTEALVAQCCWNLMRRFVTPEWFAQRVGPGFAKSDDVQ